MKPLKPAVVLRVLAFVRSGFCAFWLFCGNHWFWDFSCHWTAQNTPAIQNDSSPKAVTVDLLRFQYKMKSTDSAKIGKPKFEHDQKKVFGRGQMTISALTVL